MADFFPSLEHLGPVVDSIMKITDKIEKVERMQHFMRVREQSHRDTQESTNARIANFAIFEAVVLLSISALQVFYIQGWFSDSKSRRRV